MPGVLFGDAAIQETLASPRIQDYVRVTKLPNGQRFLFVGSERDHLEVAAACYAARCSKIPRLPKHGCGWRASSARWAGTTTRWRN